MFFMNPIGIAEVNQFEDQRTLSLLSRAASYAATSNRKVLLPKLPAQLQPKMTATTWAMFVKHVLSNIPGGYDAIIALTIINDGGKEIILANSRWFFF